MDPIKSISDNSINPISSSNKVPSGEVTFQDTFKSLVSQVEGQLEEAGQMAENFAVGKDQSLHETMIAAEKAGLSFRLLLQIRNKLLEAYQEIMRMTF